MEKGTQVVGEYRGAQRAKAPVYSLESRENAEGRYRHSRITSNRRARSCRCRQACRHPLVGAVRQRALLLSIVGDATNYASSRLQDSDVDAPKNNECQSTGGRHRGRAVHKYPADLNKHQGEPVSIFVARDLDFSGIYGLRVTEPRNRVFDRAVLGDFAPRSTLLTK